MLMKHDVFLSGQIKTHQGNIMPDINETIIQNARRNLFKYTGLLQKHEIDTEKVPIELIVCVEGDMESDNPFLKTIEQNERYLAFVDDVNEVGFEQISEHVAEALNRATTTG